AINPTPAGEGKTTVSIGLSDAINMRGKTSILALREPSLGPVFGLKGGATGGGYSQVIPMEEINLHFNGDFHAITTANNLLSSLIDNHLYQGNALNIDENRIVFNRCLDVNDRALRNVMVSNGESKREVPRKEKFNITAASEVMAIMCLSKDIHELKENLGDITIAYSKEKKAITARDINAHNAMAILLKEALKPNMVQTLAGNLALIHCGPFANIAHGCNSIIATETAMKLSEYTVTEAGFGADLGAEKFLDLKCRKLKRMPNVVVLVATVRALKMHGGIAKEELTKENVWALKKGAENLIKHIENMTKIFGLPVVVAINKFSSDTEQEIKAIKEIVAAQKVKAIVVDVWSKGGQGALELADEVIKACEEKVVTSFAYELTDKPEIKIAKIATKIYGAKTIKYSKEAEETLQEIVTRNLNELPVIIAKTQYSLSDNPKLLGVPNEHELTIRSIEIRTGAKMIVAIAGDMLLMPGLGKEPAAEKMYIDDDGNISGLF
ncbi:MAG: formate--tetrahydrofolate ligase, partial [Bacilli bacterium]|nr:formate--tetrahydrofolate ligase [Bacilli bacterium]MDD4057227.1 formate--tetrahydrofolate ligase [Bacilli bacterium]